MLYVLCISVLICINYSPLHAMEQEDDKIKKLMPFIMLEEENYFEKTYQPLVENFKQENAWSSEIVFNLLSDDQATQLHAKEECSILLNAISYQQKQLLKKQKQIAKDECCSILPPFLILGTQLFTQSYGAPESIILAIFTGEYIKNSNILDTASQAYLRHAEQLTLIHKEISEAIEQSNNPLTRNAYQKKLLLSQLPRLEKTEKTLSSVRKFIHTISRKND